MGNHVTIGGCGLAVGVCLALFPGLLTAQSKSVPRPGDVNDLSLEVTALQTLNKLELTTEQLKELIALAKGAAQKSTRKAAQVTAKYKQTLVNLHQALAQGDDDKISECKEKLDDLADSEDVDLDDDVTATDTAHERAPKAVRVLNARQIAALIGTLSVTDPLERLTEGLEEVREGEDKKQTAQEVAAEVGRLVGGKGASADRIKDKALELLKKAQDMKDADFKKQQRDLEKEAREVVGEINPLEVLTHSVENAVADLLANPRLEAAIKIQMQQKKD